MVIKKVGDREFYLSTNILQKMSVVIDGKSLTIDKVVEVARNKADISVSSESWGKINSCREMLEKKINNHEIMYGITTGIGEFSEVTLNPDQTKEFQKLLIYSHAAGIGKPMDVEIVRGAMCGRINVHSKGHSGGRKEITEYLIETLNQDLTPVVCEKGSVGACGDLSPMSQIALSLMGEGEMIVNGEIIDSKKALGEIGLEPLELEARDGLALINGSNVLTALAAITLYDAKKWMKLHDIAAAMTSLAAVNSVRQWLICGKSTVAVSVKSLPSLTRLAVSSIDSDPPNPLPHFALELENLVKTSLVDRGTPGLTRSTVWISGRSCGVITSPILAMRTHLTPPIPSSGIRARLYHSSNSRPSAEWRRASLWRRKTRAWRVSRPVRRRVRGR